MSECMNMCRLHIDECVLTTSSYTDTDYRTSEELGAIELFKLID